MSCLRVRYMMGILSTVIDEVEGGFEAFQFYKASQVMCRAVAKLSQSW